MALPTLINLAILSLLLTTSSASKHEKFLQCFLHHSKPSTNSSSQIIYTPNTKAYNTVLKSSVQNIRFLYSPTAKKPLLIVTPKNEPQVQASVICSREHNLHIRVRSGGHDYEGMSYVSETDQFIIVDMSNLRSISIDKERGTAWVQAGATLGELYYAIAKKNNTIAFPAGTCPTIGVGGHLSGGGIGALSRKYGTAADNIIDAILVDVDGRLLNRETMGEDYFWAIRGGGAASFGVVVSFKIKLVQVPSVVTTFNLIRTAETNATELVTRWQQLAPKLDENLYIRIFAAATNKTIEVLFNSLYLGRCGELEAVMNKSFPELGFEAKDCNEMSWLESILVFAFYTNRTVESLLDRTPQSNYSFKAKSDFARRPITESEWKKIWNFLIEAEDEPVVIVLEPFGGKFDEISETTIPFPHRKGILYDIQYGISWTDVDFAVTQRHLSWMKKLYKFMSPYVTSQPREAYLNYKDIDLGENHVKHENYFEAKSWGEKYFLNNFRRLALVKGKVDPQNFFRNEQSVPPLLLTS